ncbi:THAP domain-containing protein 5-like [Coccinella septempunctata]|uniref:THAP domain-containing protein 5-like n=1 Tax=Coccinella septempunctata TaxID=41139 RepID=UPI001D08C9F7|nr:THAP domain-containing protein 5-like [Coccinella septempunctata]
MVNRCVVCKKISSKSSGKSMHRMPTDSARQKLWMDQLKLKISESSKWLYVCSDHFCDEDFILKFGKKCLKTEAIPSRISLPDPW